MRERENCGALVVSKLAGRRPGWMARVFNEKAVGCLTSPYPAQYFLSAEINFTVKMQEFEAHVSSEPRERKSRFRSAQQGQLGAR